MAAIIADNIISPLGFSSEENYLALKSSKTALCHFENGKNIPFPFTASLFSPEQKQRFIIEGYTTFESLAIQSIKKALKQTSIHLDDRTALIISSTKANVDLLTGDDAIENVLSPGKAAQRIADAISLSTTPVVVCNACISGVSALILAQRFLLSGMYDYCIVCGIDIQSPFIISGFQSLKAMSEEECRPFDIERLGLNLGEAAATVVLSRKKSQSNDRWKISYGVVRNDAFHITNPSPQGEGCANAIRTVIQKKKERIESLALINAHGTATMFNDQMESKAIEASNLTEIPVNALKGYLGHTMGAAGVIETILTTKALDDGIILGTKGFEEIGVSGHITLSPDNQLTEKKDFIKIISGFGGGNAAIHLTCNELAEKTDNKTIETTIKHHIEISDTGVILDGTRITTHSTGKELLTTLYKDYVGNYPRFYKMDGLAKLGFIAAELLAQAESGERIDKDKRSVIFFNKYASVHADRAYLKTISDPENFYPSPSEFVYTLANIVNGEIAIRHKYKGETCFYVLPDRDEDTISKITQTAFLDTDIESVLAGWLEYETDEIFNANINIISKKNKKWKKSFCN